MDMRLTAKPLLVFAAALAPAADAYSTGAAICGFNAEGPAFPAGTKHAGSKRGSLEDAKLAFSIEPAEMVAGQEHALSVTRIGSDSPEFKGFLIRASGAGGMDLAGSLMKTDGDAGAGVQIMESTGEEPGGFGNPGKCAVDVSGATHKDSQAKDGVTMAVVVPGGVSGKVKFDVCIMKSALEWYYQGFEYTVVAGGGSSPANATEPVNATTPAPAPTGEETDPPAPAPTHPPSPGAKRPLAVSGVLSVLIAGMGLVLF